MSRQEFSDEQVMLTLALIGYRGFPEGDAGEAEQARLGREIGRALDRLEPVRGCWDVVWGPAAQRPPKSLFADAALYVVRDRRQPSRYVVAIRGTSPLLLFDQVFGDLGADRQVAWPYGDPELHPGAALSLGTWLGLGVVQSLRGQPGPGWLGGLQSLLGSRVVDPLEGLARTLATPVVGALQRLLPGLRRDLRRDLELLDERREHRLHAELESRIDAIRAERHSVLRRRIRRCIDDVLEQPLAEQPSALVQLLEDESRLLGRLRGGQDLKGFLAGAVQDAQQQGHPAPEIFVTGHGRGGALVPAVALWLAETQGEEDVPPAERWDPSGDARIHCTAFAAPTPGNRAFARRFDALLGERCQRFSNRLDLLPHAWLAGGSEGASRPGLRRLPALHEAVVKSSPETARLFAELAEEVAAEVEALDYVHVGGPGREFEGLLVPEQSHFLEQALHQHVEAYIQELGLEGELSLLDLSSLP